MWGAFEYRFATSDINASILATFWRKIGFLQMAPHAGIRPANAKKPGGRPAGNLRF
jgi:hypothetical protein